MHAIADADEFLSGVHDPHGLTSRSSKLGRRVLLALALNLDEHSVKAGYMRCCAGSGCARVQTLRATLKQRERLRGWGMCAASSPFALPPCHCLCHSHFLKLGLGRSERLVARDGIGRRDGRVAVSQNLC